MAEKLSAEACMRTKRKKYNTLSAQVAVSVAVGILIIGIVISNIVIFWSKKVFVHTYSISQKKVFAQIELYFNQYNSQILKITEDANDNWNLRYYLGRKDDDTSIFTYEKTYHMIKDMQRIIPDNLDASAILIVSTNGRTYQKYDDVLLKEESDILKEEITQKAAENPDIVQYEYYDSGWTSATQDIPVLIGAKAMKTSAEGKIYAYLYFIIKESTVQSKFYDQFITENTDFYLLDEDQNVVSSNRKEYLGKKLDESPLLNVMLKSDEEQSTKGTGTSQRTVFQKDLAASDLRMIGVMNTHLILKELMNEPLMILLCMVIGVIGCIVSVRLVKRIMVPLTQITDKMAKVKDGNFDQYIEGGDGTDELTDLVTTYNYMLDGLNQYVEKLMKTEEEKRKAEISALQMQINPHYIYNTLTSIKWMIWQNKYEESVQNLDAFVELLRNTISNTDEFITVDQEVRNLNNYILINNTRYGDKIKTEFFVSDECEEALVPKLVVQPFVENAYFHAFPTAEGGSIQIFINRKGRNLNIAVVDNGIGMDDTQNPLNQNNIKKTTEHYSGIGVHNVENRLKLLYGEEYGIDIRSRKGRGTTVNIVLPYRLKKYESEQISSEPEQK
jgi:two-component system sensor histidine kinase YesM